MQAAICDQDYFLRLDTLSRELQQAGQGRKLGADLTELYDSKPLGKKVVLGYGENDGPDGIEVSFVRKGDGWAGIREIHIKIGQFAYDAILRRGRFSTRYDGSNMIEIMNGIQR